MCLQASFSVIKIVVNINRFNFRKHLLSVKTSYQQFPEEWFLSQRNGNAVISQLRHWYEEPYRFKHVSRLWKQTYIVTDHKSQKWGYDNNIHQMSMFGRQRGGNGHIDKS